MAWGEEFKGGGGYISCKVGETIEIEIKAIDRIMYDPNTHKFDSCYKTKDKSLGYWDEFTTDKGILKVGAFSLAYALKSAGADVGSKLKIAHTGKGVYTVEMLGEQPF